MPGIETIKIGMKEKGLNRKIRNKLFDILKYKDDIVLFQVWWFT